MNIYIIIFDNAKGRYIESVWTTRELAESARYYHAFNAQEDIRDYDIVERELDKAQK